MKKFIYLSLIVVAAIFVVSCSKNDNSDILYQTYGVVKEESNASGKLYVRSDNGKVIITSSILSLNDKDRRVWMLFTTNGDPKADTIKAQVYNILRVTQVNIQNDGLDTLGTDVVNMNECWVAQDFLTLKMSISAMSEYTLKKHKYAMFSNLEPVNDTLHLEFRYDNNNDYGKIYNKLVAIPLSQNLNPDRDSTVLAIKYTQESGSSKTVYRTYKPGK